MVMLTLRFRTAQYLGDVGSSCCHRRTEDDQSRTKKMRSDEILGICGDVVRLCIDLHLPKVLEHFARYEEPMLYHLGISFFASSFTWEHS